MQLLLCLLSVPVIATANLPGTLHIRRDSLEWAINARGKRLISKKSGVDFVIQTGEKEVFFGGGKSLWFSPDPIGFARAFPIQEFESDVSCLSGQAGVGYFVGVNSTIPSVTILRYLLPDSKRSVEGPTIDFGKDYGRLPVTAIAYCPRGRRIAIGLGPDVYVGTLRTDQSYYAPDLWKSVESAQRVAACGFMGFGSGADQELTAFESLVWSPSGDRLVGHVRRVHGSGWSSSFLLTESHGKWISRKVPGQKFAWSPDGSLLACEVNSLGQEPTVEIREPSGRTVKRRFLGYHLLGWLK